MSTPTLTMRNGIKIRLTPSTGPKLEAIDSVPKLLPSGDWYNPKEIGLPPQARGDCGGKDVVRE